MSARPLFVGSIPAVASNFPVPYNFAFAQTVESHGWFHLAPFQWSREEGVLRRRETLPQGIVELAISFDGKMLHVAQTLLSVPLSVPHSDVLRARIARMLQLDVDTSEFVAMTRASLTHAWVEATGFGRLLCGTTLWEDAVK